MFFSEDGALAVAEANGHALLESAVDWNDALYFPYSEPFTIHDNDHSQLVPPWYSGMAQGQVLAAFVRLYEATLDPAWLVAAERTFKSFRVINENDAPWTPRAEKHNVLWFEEYPTDPPCCVLNGHIFAALGLYEYWLLTEDSDCLDLMRGAFYAIEKLGPTFRNPGGVSVYCLEHRSTNARYHDVHIAQLLTMYSLTHDPVFAHLHDDFYADTNAGRSINASLFIPAGTIETYTTWAAGSFRDRAMVEVSDDVTVTIGARIKVTGSSDYAYQIARGEYEGLIVREQPFGLTVNGLVTGAQNAYGPLYGTIRHYDPYRMALFTSSPLYAYMNEGGKLGERIQRDDFVIDGPMKVLAAGISNGSQLTLVDSFHHGEVWISSTPRYLDREDVFEW